MDLFYFQFVSFHTFAIINLNFIFAFELYITLNYITIPVQLQPIIQITYSHLHFLQNKLQINNKQMQITTQKTIATCQTLSSTSLNIPHHNPDSIQHILDNLISRKKQLINSITKYQKAYAEEQAIKVIASIQGNKIDNQQSNIWNDDQSCEINNNPKELELCATNLKSTEDQIEELQAELSTQKSMIFKLVIQLQNIQLNLKQRAEEIGKKYALLFSEKQNKLMLIELEQQITTTSLKIRPILCRFYCQSLGVNIEKGMADLGGKIAEEIIEKKLVNQLYGYVMKNKDYRRGFRFVRQQQNEESSDSDGPVLKQSQISKDHDVWLHYLKILKSLQKQPQLLDSHFSAQKITEQTSQTIKQCKSLKIESKQTKKQLQQSQNRILQISKELLQKQQHLQKLRVRMSKIEQNIQIRRMKEQERVLKQQEQQKMGVINPQQVYRKELEEVEEAIKYFMIKMESARKKSGTRCELPVDILKSRMLRSPIHACSPISMKKSEAPWSPRENTMKMLFGSSFKRYTSSSKKKVWK